MNRMNKRKIPWLLLLTVLACLFYYSNYTKNETCHTKTETDSTFCIRFIDVGQGDAALVECDGQYMLIDGGETLAGDRIYDVLKENRIQKLEILAMSHLHEDHIGGLPKAFAYAEVDLVLSNSDYFDTEAFRRLKHELNANGLKITIPDVNDKYFLGSAEIEVVDVSSEEDNDSLVLLITYGETRFLFTGDIEGAAQKRIAEKYYNDEDEPYKIDLLKIPHHGSFTSNDSLYQFLRTFMPDYSVISVGENNRYNHPSERTLSMLRDLYKDKYDKRIFRTDTDGDIIVSSDGVELTITTSK